MKTPNKQKLQRIASNNLSYIDFKILHNHILFLFFFDTTIASDNLSRFRENLLERI